MGAGQFGTTYLCTEKKTGLQYACKTIPKSKLLTEDDVEDVRREVAILYHVQVGKIHLGVEDREKTNRNVLTRACLRLDCATSFSSKNAESGEFPIK